MKKTILLVAFVFCALASLAAQPLVKTGVEVLRERDFEPLKGKRVGLVTNPSGVDSQLRSTIDILFNAPGRIL